MLCSAARSRTKAIACSIVPRSENDRQLQLHPSGLHLGEVEDLVQQLEKVVPRVEDVPQVFLLTLVQITEHPLEQHLGESDDGVQRCSQLVRHAGQKVRLVLASHLQFGSLALELAKHPSVEYRQRGLAGERLHELLDLVGELAGGLPPDHHDTDDLAAAQHRNREDRPPAVLEQELQMDVPLDLRNVGYPDRPPLLGRPPDQSLVQLDVEAA